ADVPLPERRVDGRSPRDPRGVPGQDPAHGPAHQDEPGHHRGAVRRGQDRGPHGLELRRDGDGARAPGRRRGHRDGRLRDGQGDLRRPEPAGGDAGVHVGQDQGPGRHDQADDHAADGHRPGGPRGRRPDQGHHRV
ncbi:MAG: hypothetical protein AVDCRST_MAG20-139, partial [uncultured Acidimicrobiales bacterium]